MEKPPERPTTLALPPRKDSNPLLRQPLPSPPPDPRENFSENIFKYPPLKCDLPCAYRCLIESTRRDQEFYKLLNKAIETDCQHIRGIDTLRKTLNEKTSASNESLAHQCNHCEDLRNECYQYIQPLQVRFQSSAAAAIAAYGAVDQLNRLYSMWDQYLDVEKRWRQRKECYKYVNLLEQKVKPTNDKNDMKGKKMHLSDTEAELEHSITLLESMLTSGNSAVAKRNLMKQQRERSKSVVMEDSGSLQKFCESKFATGPNLLRRQSTYSDGKSKVSKWTKVKAAFKWERANVPALTERDFQNGLQPLNHEVARYLRVPSVPCGGVSSNDSILSSSSGHLLSEAGTPGTISSASSMDDLDNTNRNGLRRDSSKSDTRCDSRIAESTDLSPTRRDSLKPLQIDDLDGRRFSKSEAVKGLLTSKSGSNKSLRKNKVVSDFEAVPEDVVADIKSGTGRKTKVPPSPLNLNIKQDLHDSECYYLPHLTKSPANPILVSKGKKVNSPGNSSVPSSPSRHSDFFAEFESEDFSSGDFSEPSTPNNLSLQKTRQQNREEINQRYQLLRAKLDMEFETKRREWDKMKNNPNNSRGLSLITPPKSEELSPNIKLEAGSQTKILEENLTPDFKKKLNKWRVKKQISHTGGSISPQNCTAPVSPNRDIKDQKECKEIICDGKTKIDWNLWRTGQLKLEGQGLCQLPDHKDLPEEFQKKLEQWNKIKRGSVNASSSDSLKRNSKGSSKNKGSDDDRCHWDKRDKHKTHDKDKLEKLAKLKAIVTDHPAKEIEVKTSAGNVMKFEGISRKFTRKLYEWEKSRGIGPESSTFALLHPGYCPIDVGRIKESTNNENSPTLSRSLSLDSMPPNCTLPIISQQASSLSLNDVNELKEAAESCPVALAETEFKRFDEPEAVMVEVEDHIVETASPLVTAHTLVEHQTPVYKYEEVACQDYCNTRRIQSFESPTNIAPLLDALQRSDELFDTIKTVSSDMALNPDLIACENSLKAIRNIYPYYTDNLLKPNVLNAMSDVHIELSRLSDLNIKSPLNEPCCTDVMQERNLEYTEELKGLQISLDLLRQIIQGGENRIPKDMVPDINIIPDDNQSSSLCTTGDNTSGDHLSNLLDEQGPANLDIDTESASTIRRFNPNQAIHSNSFNNGCKKKMRLRKMGSRQNSKTESDSSDAEGQNILETPRRLKRKNFRLKQRSFDEDYRRNEEDRIGENILYCLKVKPGQPIEQCEKIVEDIEIPNEAKQQNQQKLAGSGNDVETTHTILSQNPNLFVKTKRKLFTAIQEPTASEGVTLIVKDIDTGNSSDAEASKKKHDISKNHPIHTDGSFSKIKPLLRKSLSLTNIKLHSFEDERKCCSEEICKSLEEKIRKDVRPPLASDSFRVINKSLSSKDSLRKNSIPEVLRKDNLYKKHSEKLIKSVGATVKKIENKISKTNSGSSVEGFAVQQQNKTGNTLPKIYRKLERKSETPTVKKFQFDYATPQPAHSEPSTPSCEQPGKPRTPLSERAKRLAKAKEQFLQGILPIVSVKRRDDIVRNETWEQYRRSDQSHLNAVLDEDGQLHKSLSVDTIRANTPSASETGTDVESNNYHSLPGSVVRSEKISSKLGFATLASKFRRVKLKKNKDPVSGSSALTALCKQSLLADIIAVPQIMDSTSNKPNENLMKSLSTPHTSSKPPAPISARQEADGLNKSRSEQITKRQKESCV